MSADYDLETAHGKVEVPLACVPDDCLTYDEIVEYAQEQVKRIQRDRDNLARAEDIKRNGGDEAAAREFERVDWLRQGEQIALRNVCEWAKAQIDSGRL